MRFVFVFFVVLSIGACGPVGPADSESDAGTSDAGNDGGDAEINCLVVSNAVPDLHTREGCRTETALTVRNACMRDVVVTAHHADVLELTSAPALRPEGLVLHPDAELIYSLAFEPPSGGPFDGALTIDWTSAGAAATTSFPLRVIAEAAPRQTDVHVVPPPPAADVLIVLDNGTTLASQRASIRKNLAAFAKYFESYGRQTNVALATVAGTGAFAPGELVTVLDSGAPDFSASFLGVVDAIELRPSSHQTLAAARAALDRSESSTVLRDQTSFALVLISDSPDLSDDDPDAFVDFVKSKKRSGSLSGIDVVAPFAPFTGCADQMDDGRFARVVNLSNGARESLCIADWWKTFEPVSGGEWSRYSVTLSRVPDIRSPIDVTIDGVAVDRLDNRDSVVWTWDSDFNRLLFEPLFAPEPGQTLTATYRLTCGEAP